MWADTALTKAPGTAAAAAATPQTEQQSKCRL